MKTNIMRNVSIFLSFVIILTLFPSSVFAVGELEPELSESVSLDEVSQVSSAPSRDYYALLDSGDIVLEGEDASFREPTSKHFRLSIGQMLAIAYPFDVHYEDEGGLKDIDNTLYEDLDGKTLRNTANSVDIALPRTFADDGPVSFSSEGYTVTFILDGAASSDAVLLTDERKYEKEYLAMIEAPMKGSFVIYEDVLPDTDAKYEIYGKVLKEELVIKEPGSTFESFSFTIGAEGLAAELREDQSIVFSDHTEEPIFIVPAPRLYEAESGLAGPVTAELEIVSEGVYSLSYILDPDWMDAADRSYPVILDPTITSAKSIDNRTTTMACSAQPNADMTAASPIYTGKKDASTYGICRAYIKINTLPTLKSSDSIVNASLVFSSVAASNGIECIKANMIGSETELDYSLINWNDQPEYESRVLDFCYDDEDDHYGSLNVTRAVRRWYEGTAVNNGVMIRFSNESDNGKYAFIYVGSASSPYLRVIYTNSNGLSDWWDYSSASCGRAGTVHVQDFSGNLTLQRTDFAFGDDILPFPITFTYNHCSQATDLGYGKGVRCIYNQNVDTQTIGGKTYYRWIDGDSTQIYFDPEKDYDELGLGYECYITGSGIHSHFVVKDRDLNEYHFDENYGKLTEIREFKGHINGSNRYRYTYITYTSGASGQNRIAAITDDGGRVFRFNYSDPLTGRLSSIDYLGTGNTSLATVSYTYTSGRLTKVTYPDNEDVRYTWSSGDLATVKDILKSDDTRDQISITYSGGSSYRPENVSGLEFRSGGIIMSGLSFEYGEQTTKVTDLNGHYLQYQFNADGNTTGVINDRGQAVYGRYEKDTDVSAYPNRLSASSRLHDSAGTDDIVLSLSDGSNTESIDLYSEENLILNPDFTSGLNDEWVKASSTTPTFSRVSVNEARGGLDKWALRLTGLSYRQIAVKQVLEVSDGAAGDILSFGGWVKSTGQLLLNDNDDVREAGIKVKLYNNTTLKQTEYIPMNMGCADWQYIGRQINAEYSYNKIEIWLVYNYEMGYIWLDGPCLTRKPNEYLFAYDNDGRVKSVTDPEGNKTRFVYSYGALRTIYFPDGSRFDNTIDHGTITQSSSAEGIDTYYDYDLYGDLLETSTHPDVSGAKEMLSSATYTSGTGMPASVTGTDGNTVTYSNDSEKLQVNSITDPSNVTTSFAYDDLGRQLSQTTLGSSVLSVYSDDMLSSLAHTNTGSTNTVYTFTYGPGGLPISSSIGQRTLSTKLYNTGTWTLASETFGNGDYVKYSYDESEMLESSFTDHTQTAGAGFEYFYNARGELCRVITSDVTIANGEAASSTPKGSVNYLYNANGSLTRLIRTDILPNTQSELLVLDASLTYNENGELTGLTERIKKGGGVRTTEYTYAYDHDGRPVSSEYGEVTEEKTYDAWGRLTGEVMTYGEDTAYSRTYTYKDLSSTRTTAQVQSLSLSFGNSSLSHSYTYDANGRIASDTTSSAASVYLYDGLGQLIWEKNGGKGKAWRYTYDLGGNILSKTEYNYSGGTVGSQTGQKLYTYGDSEWHDLLTSYDGTPITYDTIGNPLSYRGWTMDWQAGRQLRSMSKNSTSLSLEYDESGLRTKKTVGTDVTKYIWNGDRLVAQLGSSASFFFHYDAAGEMIGYTYAPASGTEKECFFVKNLQGDVERVVTSTGSIVAQYNYDAWGNVLTWSGSMSEINPIRYRGYYFDTESGLYYLKSRYYDPQVGRFINADALVDAGRRSVGLNLFAYCLNDPNNSIDNSGFATVGIGVEGSATLKDGYRISGGTQFVVDSEGQRGSILYTSGGIGTEAKPGGVVTITITNAKCLDDLEDWGESSGMSFTKFGIEYVSGSTYKGVTISLGIVEPEIHTEGTYTKVLYKKKVQTDGYDYFYQK